MDVDLADQLTAREIDRVIEMAWEDRTTFEAIEFQFGLAEADVIALMRSQLRPGSFRAWRKRVSGRRTKHGSTSKSDRFRAACHKWNDRIQIRLQAQCVDHRCLQWHRTGHGSSPAGSRLDRVCSRTPA